MKPSVIRILYESAHVLVVDKPAGLLVEHSPHHPSVEDWAWTHVRAQPGKDYIGIVHRLDRAVSGVLALAKRKSALRDLHRQFARREVRKVYWALVEAPPPAASGELRHWLEKDQRGKRALIHNRPDPRAVEVGLGYRLLSRQATGWLLEIDLFTGKFHQIRAQLAAIGCPIFGDVRYGAAQACLPEAIALHARQLTFTDPSTQERIEVIAPPPDTAFWPAA